MLTQLAKCLAAGLALLAAGPPGLAFGAAKPEGIGVPPLDSWRADLAIWTAVVFLVVLALLWKFAWNPIAQGLDRRERGIADQIAQAEQANRDAKEVLARYDQKLAAAGDEVRGIVELGRRDAEQIGREMIDKAKAEARAEQQQALKQIDAATTSALKELADRSATLAVELAGKIVRAKIDPAEHTRLIEQAVAGFSAGEPSDN